MGIIKTAALGFVGYLAYRALRRNQAGKSAPAQEPPSTKPATSSAAARLEDAGVETEAPRLAQSSRGFGGA